MKPTSETKRSGRHWWVHSYKESEYDADEYFTADEYGTSEDVLGKWFAANPDKRKHIFLSSKVGMKLTPDQVPPFKIDSAPEYCREAIESSLRRLNLHAESLRRTHTVHPITAVQVEYSLFCRAIESPQIRLLETARELSVAIVCYSPHGNGFFTNTIRTREDVKPGNARGHLPWLNEENLEHNVAVVEKIASIAASKGVSSA
ncbi:Aldo/keto reductase [Penicillium italicum]|uniref:Aldo/keto reductase n=1 Tax=Penicillium italicum TaxID=40296 RepID=A0A0A2L885_PENIT|nr:Aldo/keto reductase [Penicillium italicum]